MEALDTFLHPMAMGMVMQREVWLHSSGFLRDDQAIIEDLTFDESHLFSQKADSPLQSLKDSRAILQSLGIYTLAPKCKSYYLPSRQ